MEKKPLTAIQNRILRALSEADLNSSQLLHKFGKSVMVHLKQLTKDGYVVALGDNYSLTKSGNGVCPKPILDPPAVKTNYQGKKTESINIKERLDVDALSQPTSPIFTGKITTIEEHLSKVFEKHTLLDIVNHLIVVKKLPRKGLGKIFTKRDANGGFAVSKDIWKLKFMKVVDYEDDFVTLGPKASEFLLKKTKVRTNKVLDAKGKKPTLVARPAAVEVPKAEPIEVVKDMPIDKQNFDTFEIPALDKYLRSGPKKVSEISFAISSKQTLIIMGVIDKPIEIDKAATMHLINFMDRCKSALLDVVLNISEN